MQAPDDSSTPRRRPAGKKQAAAKKVPAKKVPAKKAPAKKVPAKAPPATASPAKKVPAKKVPPKAPPVTASPAKAPPAKKVPATASPATKAPVRKAAALEPPPRERRPEHPRSDAGRAIPAAGRRGGAPDEVLSRRGLRLAVTIRRLRRAIAALLILGLCGFLIDGASRPADPKLVPANDPTAVKGSPPMGTATLSVSSHAGAPACVLEAVTPQQQAFGLMGRTSVAPYAGMAFVFASPSVERFWMKRTVMALSIAWFDAAGRFEAEASMPPCPQSVRNCPTYGPGRPYSLAVEVPAGRLGSLGIGPGSVVQVGGPCT